MENIYIKKKTKYIYFSININENLSKRSILEPISHVSSMQIFPRTGCFKIIIKF